MLRGNDAEPLRNDVENADGGLALGDTDCGEPDCGDDVNIVDGELGAGEQRGK